MNKGQLHQCIDVAVFTSQCTAVYLLQKPFGTRHQTNGIFSPPNIEYTPTALCAHRHQTLLHVKQKDYHKFLHTYTYTTGTNFHNGSNGCNIWIFSCFSTYLMRLAKIRIASFHSCRSLLMWNTSRSDIPCSLSKAPASLLVLHTFADALDSISCMYS